MSTQNIQEKLNRLEAARIAHIIALTNKGASIPSNTGFEEFADLIRTLVISNDDSPPLTDDSRNDATAEASHILTPYQAIGLDGKMLKGTMIDNGAISKKLITSLTSYSLPTGYHNGSGKVYITTQDKTVTATTSAQTITPSSGYFLSKVTVNPVASKTMYSGTITSMQYSNQCTIDTGISPISSSAIFCLFNDNSAGGTGLESVTAVVKNGTSGTYGIYMDGNSFRAGCMTPSVSYFGSSVTVSLTDFYFNYQTTHYWYLFT